MDKWRKNIKKQQQKILVSSTILALLLTAMARKINDEVVFEYFRIFFKTILILEFALLLLGKYIIWKSNQKTTFSFFYKVNSFPLIFFLFFMGIGLYPIKLVTPDLGLNLMFNFFLFAFALFPVYYFQQAYQHLQFEKKLKFS